MPGGCASCQEAGKPEPQRGKCRARAESPRGPAGRPWGWLWISLWFWCWLLSLLFVHKYLQVLPADLVDSALSVHTENRAGVKSVGMPVLQHLSMCGRGGEGAKVGGQRPTATRGGINNAVATVGDCPLSKTLGLHGGSPGFSLSEAGFWLHFTSHSFGKGIHTAINMG